MPALMFQSRFCAVAADRGLESRVGGRAEDLQRQCLSDTTCAAPYRSAQTKTPVTDAWCPPAAHFACFC